MILFLKYHLMCCHLSQCLFHILQKLIVFRSNAEFSRAHKKMFLNVLSRRKKMVLRLITYPAYRVVNVARGGEE